MVIFSAALFAVGSRASDGGNRRIIHIQEHVTNATYVPVYTLVGGNGPSTQGDYIAFDDPIFDPDTGQQVGHDMSIALAKTRPHGRRSSTCFRRGPRCATSST